FSELPVNGQVNLLTSTSFDRPQDLFTLNGPAPRGVAYVAIEAPGATGDWTMRGTMTQGDLASWILAGSYVRHQPSAHVYEAGVSYATQRYLGGNGEALGAMRHGRRKGRTTVMRREVAAGAEEFIPPSVGLWLPPERTFSQVRRASFVPERHNQIEISVERDQK